MSVSTVFILLGVLLFIFILMACIYKCLLYCLNKLDDNNQENQDLLPIIPTSIEDKRERLIPDLT